MTRQIHRWIAALMAVAATALTVGLVAASHASASHPHVIAGISLNALD